MVKGQVAAEKQQDRERPNAIEEIGQRKARTNSQRVSPRLRNIKL